MRDDEEKEDDEMLPEYDFSELKLVGRGIYAEQYRAGVKFIIRDERNHVENESDEGNDKGGES